MDPNLSRDESAAMARRRRSRNLVMLVVLLGVAVLFYAITIVKFGAPHAAP
jgi:hypothetical protein